MAAPARAKAAAAPGCMALSFSALRGWQDDDHDAVLPVFLATCQDIPDPEWRAIAAARPGQEPSRAFFERCFRPILIKNGTAPLFTGYFEPELAGARRRTARFCHPIHRPPPDLQRHHPWHSRREIEERRLLEGQGLEIVWLEDPVDVFFLHVQGSGRIRLADGSVLRVGHADANGHEYRSIGRELVRRGVFPPHRISASAIRAWLRRNPAAATELLRLNPSYIFFRELSGMSADSGPLGAMNRPLTARRSLAVDPQHTPLGAPVWVEMDGRQPMRRLMVAQDIGSAIKGAQRADIFFGTGDAAGRAAGCICDPGRMVVLLPRRQAHALVQGSGT